MSYINILYKGTASGTNTYTALITNLSSYQIGQKFAVKFTNANTASSTLNINSFGALTIKKNGTQNLNAGDISANQIYLLEYDGTNLQVLSETVDTPIFLQAISSSLNIYTAASTPTQTSYINGRSFLVKFLYANTNSASLNIDSLGARNILRNSGSKTERNDFKRNQTYHLLYSGSNFYVLDKGKVDLLTDVTHSLQLQNGGTATGSANLFYLFLNQNFK